MPKGLKFIQRAFRRTRDAKSQNHDPPAQSTTTPTIIATSKTVVPDSSSAAAIDAASADQAPSFQQGPAVSDAQSSSSASSVSSPASDSGTKKEGRGRVWNALETSLRVLKESSDAFPPLKSATGGLLACMDVIQAAAANREDYENIADELKVMVETLTQYSSGLASSGQSGNVSRILQSIEAETSHIRQKQDHGRVRRIFDAPQDKEDVLKRHQRINSLFRQLQTDISLRTSDHTRKLREHSLLQELSPVHDARYNSSFSTTINRGGCTAKTREQILQELQDWARDADGVKVFWTSGMAGTGKSTISYSFCEWLENEQRLGGNFFCSRLSSSCNKAESIVSTIAYQLARYSPAFQAALCHVLDDTPDASKRDIRWQFEKLIEQPLGKVAGAMEEGVIVVIDALDECMDTAAVGLFLETALKAISRLPIKLFLTSRPEPVIQEKFRKSGFVDSVLHLHDIEESIVAGDIRVYLTEALSSMDPLPSPSEIQQLAQRSGRLFIYAATAVRYILPPDDFSVDSTNRFQTVIQSPSGTGPTRQYDELNALYTSILFAALKNAKLEPKEAENRRRVLWTCVSVMEPVTIQTLAPLLRIPEREVAFSLRPLQSLLHMQQANGLVSAFHLSFPDFMFDKMRSNEFYCDKRVHNEELARACFGVMKSELKFNICHLESSFVLDEEVPDLSERVGKYISPVLSYTCRHWGAHLQQGAKTPEAHEELVDFLTGRVLFWMEVLNLQKRMKAGEANLERANSWLEVHQAEARVLVADATHFVIRYTASACSRSTPHIYVSSLPFTLRSSSIYANYWKHTRGLLEMKGAVVEGRSGGTALGVWRMGATVTAVAFSPDGNRIVCALTNRTIQVLDAQTGALIAGPVAVHENSRKSLKSVAFSSDGTSVFSADDAIVCVWDVQTGRVMSEIFTGHHRPIAPHSTSIFKSVAFPRNGIPGFSTSNDTAARIWDTPSGRMTDGLFIGAKNCVSFLAVSFDGDSVPSVPDGRTIQVFDAKTGKSIAGPFTLHDGSHHIVTSLAFSDDGTHVVSGSMDKTVRVWDAQTGRAIGGRPFVGHTRQISSVAFSLDGARVVSGSDDRTVRVWDTQTGRSIAGPFTGHESYVVSVAFSPDGARVVSGSLDKTVRVWNTQPSSIEQSVAAFDTGHGKRVVFVAFFGDNARIISCSLDGKIRAWDAQTGRSIHESRYHHSFRSVACSGDGTRFVFGADDKTVRIWDAQNDIVIAGPLTGHKSSVSCVAFSRNGTRVVSGSDDKTVRVWDAQTGRAIGSPFVGRHKDQIGCVAFCPDGTRVASGSWDRTVRVWDVRSGRSVSMAGPLRGPVRCVAFSGDGSRVVAGSFRDVWVWHAQTGQLILEPFVGHEKWINCVAFSADGTRVASGWSDKEIRVWNVQTGQMVGGPFVGHEGAVESVMFSSDGKRIVSASADKAIRVWDISPSFGSSYAHLKEEFPDVSNFELDTDGWISYHGARLLWIPLDVRSHMPYPRNPFIVGPKGTSFADYKQFVAFGKSWTGCYASAGH